VNDILDGPDITAVEQEITAAMDALGVDSTTVAERLDAMGYTATSDDGAYMLCEYLQDHIDAGAETVTIDFCDTLTVDFSVINPDGETWTRSCTGLPWPVLIFCCRADECCGNPKAAA
jgi:hypothetical protein